MLEALTIGNFVFDRGHQVELALLSDDGAIHLADKGSPDRREFTAAEIEFMRQQRIAWHKGQQDMQSFAKQMDKLVRPSSKAAAVQGSWNVTETLNSAAMPPFSGAPGLLQSAKMSGLSLDDLLVGNDADHSVQVVKNSQDVLKLKIKNAEALAQTTSVKVEGAPLAAVAMRVCVNGLPGLVVLHEGQPEPTVRINSPNATFVVNTTADQIETSPANGLCNSTGGCSLRAAITQSNYVGGSNAITVPNGTYTLTLGPWDDEFNTLGANMDAGDLDVIDLSFGGFPLLTAVTLNGGGRDTTIIQMGTLVPGSGGISKDRVIESNNFVIPQHGTHLTLNNLTIQNGNAPRTPAPDNYNTKGGGIQFDGFDSPSSTNLGTLTLTNTKFATNTSGRPGRRHSGDIRRSDSSEHQYRHREHYYLRSWRRYSAFRRQRDHHHLYDRQQHHRWGDSWRGQHRRRRQFRQRRRCRFRWCQCFQHNRWQRRPKQQWWSSEWP